MPKRFYPFVLVMIITTMFFSVGCSSENSNNNKIAYVSANTDSEYNNTLQKLKLGEFFDFNLKLPNADKSWITIWVEGYSNGKAVEPVRLIELSYGLNPKKVVEGQMGFGIINYNNEPQIFLLSEGVRTDFHNIDNNLLSRDVPSCWDYAIGSKSIGIEPGEEVLLGVYRQEEGPLAAGYDYTDLNSVKQMISENTTVLLLKIKVEKKEKL